MIVHDTNFFFEKNHLEKSFRVIVPFRDGSNCVTESIKDVKVTACVKIDVQGRTGIASLENRIWFVKSNSPANKHNRIRT